MKLVIQKIFFRFQPLMEMSIIITTTHKLLYTNIIIFFIVYKYNVKCNMLVITF